MENQAYVFVSNKDNNSIFLVQELQKINNWQNLFSIVSVHAQKNLVRHYNIQKVPSILWDDHLFIGQDALSFVQENIEQKKPKHREIEPLSDYDKEEFSSLGQLNQQIPTFTKIEESGSSKNLTDLDINSRMEQYNSQRKAIDNMIEKNKPR